MPSNEIVTLFNQLKSSLSVALQKSNQIQDIINQTERTDVEIESNGVNDVDEIDLIDRLQLALDRLQIDCELSRAVNKEDVRNRASYYFDHIQSITNPRAYLTKVVSQIAIKNRTEVSQPPADHSNDLSPEYASQLLDLFDMLKDTDIEKVRFENETIHWMIQGRNRDNFLKFHKIMITQKAIELGLIFPNINSDDIK